MQYEAKLTAENGAILTFEFEADMACLAVDHLIHVSNDPSLLAFEAGRGRSGIVRWDKWDKEPEGNVVKMEYRRLYKNGGYSNWRVA